MSGQGFQHVIGGVSDELQGLAWAAATSEIQNVHELEQADALSEAQRRGIRLLIKAEGECIICPRPSKYLSALDRRNGQRLVIFFVCERHKTVSPYMVSQIEGASSEHDRINEALA